MFKPPDVSAATAGYERCLLCAAARQQPGRTGRLVELANNTAISFAAACMSVRFPLPTSIGFVAIEAAIKRAKKIVWNAENLLFTEIS